MNQPRYVNLFFDMDGVLCRYITEDYMANPLTGAMRFQDPSIHYFKNLEADENAVLLFKAYYSMLQQMSQCPKHLFICTTIVQANPQDQEVYIEDKGQWLMDHILEPKPPAIMRDYAAFTFDYDRDFLFARCPTTKPDVAERRLNRKLLPTDILIDDFNDNLEQWKAAGGTAVKYLNGINSPTDRFLTIDGVNDDVATLKANLDAIATSMFEYATTQ